MTGEVRLFEEEALNLPGAAAMAAGGSVERGPPMVDRWGPYARNVSGLHRLSESVALAGIDRSGERAEDCLWVKMVEARGVSGLHRLPEVWCWERCSAVAFVTG
ncbi:hypothetical protein TH44_05075 [Thalassospira xiamenensis]|uniref:Uncharacterized protein n=1 Tax=Thalassospira xiamenensis TaxID=220697 RepID=A0A367XGC7_9PROT|nr:hypothetical protein AUP41_18255 [Thalassospira xiamenensis]RCK51801.1 hypothetical protein TH44_05075 [Thalassospira xiamenensis]